MRCGDPKYAVVFVHRELVERTAGDDAYGCEGKRLRNGIDLEPENRGGVRINLGCLVVIIAIAGS